MKKNIGFAMMAISLAGCASFSRTPQSYQGRMIEFKSGAEGFDTRTFFYEGEKEVVAFDSQFTPELARQSLAHLRKFTNKPISWLVITHPNPDKFNGASVFKAEGAKIISSVSTAQAIPEVHAYKKYFFVKLAKMFTEENYPNLTAVDQTFERQTDLILQGGEKIELRELSHPGVSSTQTVAYVPSLKSLMVGDLIHHEAHAWLEGGIVKGQARPTLKEWIWDLQELSTLFPAEAQVFAGRGVTVDLASAVVAQVNYLERARELVRQELKALKKDLTEAEAPQFYKKLATKFSSQFPNYKIPYMIEYGVYGLVQSEKNIR